ncbi:MAG: helix-turn-helix domain-containing protein [Candidatus Marinimicrobia bacterium]|nr:helix-turn-helix domain-containing protein [Candidatus Neomarinimicrobiota bacterium]
MLVINVSPSRYIRKIRLGRAKQLLVQKVGNVTETAYKVCFGNSSYFTKCYKEEFDKVRLESENLSQYKPDQ